MNQSRCYRDHGLVLVTIMAVVVALSPSPVMAAADPNGGAAGDWLSQYASARSVGLGGAFVAVADEASGVLWNPAGIGRLDRHEVQLGTVRLFEGTSINKLSFAVPNRHLPSFGLTILSLNSGDFEQTNELNERLGEFSNKDFAFLLSGALNLSTRWSLGANLKVAHQSIEEFSASGVGADLGVMGELNDMVSLGASLLNLGGPSLTLREVDESYPEEFRAGLALHLLDGNGLISAEIAHREGPGTQVRAGGEFWIHSSLGLRLGYYAENIAGGFSYRFGGSWQFDYGVSDHTLGVTHRFGLTYRFGGFFAKSQAVPEIFSPTGQNPVTKFLLTTRTKAEAQEWRLEIHNKSDEVVRSFGGQGVPPAHILWDGKDEAGLPLPDGVYRYWLTVHDFEGRELISQQRSVEISTGGPEGSVPVVIE